MNTLPETLEDLLARMERYGPFRVVGRDEACVRLEIEGMIFTFTPSRAQAFLLGAERALSRGLSRHPYARF